MMSSDQQASSPPPASEPALLSEAPRVAPAASERRASNKQQSTGASGSGTGSTRTSLACRACRDKKVKCSGELPCQQCVKKNLACVFPNTARKRLFSVVEVESLRQQAAFYADAFARSARPSEDGENGPVNNTASVTDLQHEMSEHTPSQATPPVSAPQTFSLDAQCASYDRQPNIAGSLAAETPGRPISYENMSNSSHSTIVASSMPSSREQLAKEVSGLASVSSRHIELASNAGDSYGLAAQHATPATSTPGSSTWPSEATAHRLFDSMQRYFGQSQHLLEPRAFQDQMCLYYSRGEEAATKAVDSLWLAQALLVFALGSYQDCIALHGRELPGSGFYAESLRHIPSVLRLRQHGLLGVEVMALLATYLQSADCKDDAYVASGTALRLAVSQGLHRSTTNSTHLRSEQVHRIRLWWTIYMQERRLASLTGNPHGIDDSAITVQLPFEAPGFSPAAALCVNISIARITGDIMSKIYYSRLESSESFNSEVQGILSRLHDIMRTIPEPYRLDFSNKFLKVSRLSASLNMMLSQAIILATRPTLLHMARAKARGDEMPTNSGSTQVVHKLSQACIDAAERISRILLALKRQGLLGRFGFFDQEASFSVAFVFILAETVNPTPRSALGIGDACHIIRYLASSGNKTALKLLSEIQQMCVNLSIPLQLTGSRDVVDGGDWASQADLESSSAEQLGRTALGEAFSLPDGDVASQQMGLSTETLTGDRINFDTVDPARGDMGGLYLSLGEESFLDANSDLYSWYHEMDLRGIDWEDWERLDLQFRK